MPGVLSDDRSRLSIDEDARHRRTPVHFSLGPFFPIALYATQQQEVNATESFSSALIAIAGYIKQT